MTTILLYEDNDALRASITTMLQMAPGLSVVGDFKDACDATAHVRELNPAVILMDIDMPGITGVEAVRQIRKTNREVPILMLTVFDDNESVFGALRAGASGYLLKKHVSSRLLTAIEEVQEGGAPMSPAIARMVISSLHEGTPTRYELTARELEILSALAKGNSYKLIAALSGISIDTVRTHIKNIYAKLQVHTQTEAVAKAINERLV